MTKISEWAQKAVNWAFDAPTRETHHVNYSGDKGDRRVSYTTLAYPRSNQTDTIGILIYNPATDELTLSRNIQDNSNVGYVPSYGDNMWVVKDMNEEDGARANNLARLYIRQGLERKMSKGGNLNYAKYLQGGGLLEQIVTLIQDAYKEVQNPTEDTAHGALATLMDGLKDEKTKMLIDEVAKKDPQLNLALSYIKEMVGVTDDDSAEIPANKCGGKVAKKVRKHACGAKAKKAQEGMEIEEEKRGGKAKKAEFGSPIKKAGAGCPCLKILRRNGGKLEEVDSCTGMPIHRHGGHLIPKAFLGMKLTNPFSSWEEFQRLVGYPVEWAYNKGKLYWPALKTYWEENMLEHKMDGSPLDATTGAAVKVGSTNSQGLWVKNQNGDYQYQKGDKVYFKNGKVYDTKSGQFTNYNMADLGLSDADLVKYSFKTNENIEETPGNDVTTENNGWAKDGNFWVKGNERKASIDNAGRTFDVNTGSYSGQTYGERNALAAEWKGASGQGATVAERRAWMNDPEVLKYLATLNGGRGLGYTSDLIGNLGAANTALINAYKNYGAWKAQQLAAAYDPTKQALPQNATAELQAAYKAAVTNGTAFGLSDAEKAGRSFATAQDRSNQALLGMDAKSALYLNNDDYLRWLRLNSAKMSDDITRQNSLTFNGKVYADENAYNTAVGSYNQQQLQNLILAMAAAKGRKARNAVMNDQKYALASNYQAPTDFKLNTTNLSANTFGGAATSTTNNLSSAIRPAVTPTSAQQTLNLSFMHKNGGVMSYKNYLK